MTPTELSSTPWWIIIGGALPSITGGLFVVWKLWYERGTKRAELQLTREERVMRDTDTRIKLAAGVDADVIARAVTEIAGLIAKNKELELDRNRGWNLARYWYGYIFDAWRIWTNKSIAADIAMRNAGLAPPIEWPDRSKIPDFEAPYPNVKS